MDNGQTFDVPLRRTLAHRQVGLLIVAVVTILGTAILHLTVPLTPEDFDGPN